MSKADIAGCVFHVDAVCRDPRLFARTVGQSCSCVLVTLSLTQFLPLFHLHRFVIREVTNTTGRDRPLGRGILVSAQPRFTINLCELYLAGVHLRKVQIHLKEVQLGCGMCSQFEEESPLIVHTHLSTARRPPGLTALRLPICRLPGCTPRFISSTRLAARKLLPSSSKSYHILHSQRGRD